MLFIPTVATKWWIQYQRPSPIKMGLFSKIIVDCMRRDKFREQNRFSVMSDCFSVLLSKLVSAHQQSQIIFLSTQKMPITIPQKSSKIFVATLLHLIWLTVGHVTRARWERRCGKYWRSVSVHIFLKAGEPFYQQKFI